VKRAISPRRLIASLLPRPLSTHPMRSLFVARAARPSPVLGSVSPALREFTEEFSLERRSILEFVVAYANELEPGARVLDAGAGDAPYRELFNHCEYVTTDWSGSLHRGAKGADIIASLDRLPVADGSFDAVLCTQVLEHVDDPHRTLIELCRVLRPGGRLGLTAPLVWPLHEQPFDFFRFTPYGIEALLRRAGFTDLAVSPRNGYFATIAQLLRLAPDAVGSPERGDARTRVRLFEDLSRLATQLEALDGIDERHTFPLGYQATARRPAATS
jgi:SAM-dependent methyltransferase